MLLFHAITFFAFSGPNIYPTPILETHHLFIFYYAGIYPLGQLLAGIIRRYMYHFVLAECLFCT